MNLRQNVITGELKLQILILESNIIPRSPNDIDQKEAGSLNNKHTLLRIDLGTQI